jgi:hypothetical protein
MLVKEEGKNEFYQRTPSIRQRFDRCWRLRKRVIAAQHAFAMKVKTSNKTERTGL